MPVNYLISGFSQYVIIDKIMYRNAYKIQMINGNWQYRQKRIVKKTLNNGILGYILIKDNNIKPKFYNQKRLKHRLIKVYTNSV